MKKYDMNTRQGRKRRGACGEQFNPDTLLPHSTLHIVKNTARKLARRADKARRWSRIMNPNVDGVRTDLGERA